MGLPDKVTGDVAIPQGGGDWIAAARPDCPGEAGQAAFPGAPDHHDFTGATQFRLLTALGLREDHYLLDFGCGSLRAGRLLMFYLRPGRYFGIEPDAWLVEAARASEIGADAFALRRPRFDHGAGMRMDVFGRSFDFIVAQSAFSAAGGDLLDRALGQAARVLSPGGQMLFTVRDDSLPSWGRSRGDDTTAGRSRPGRDGLTPGDVLSRADRAGLAAEPLDWFHPRRRWYRATLPGTPPLSASDRAAIGRGAVLFDPRFPS